MKYYLFIFSFLTLYISIIQDTNIAQTKSVTISGLITNRTTGDPLIGTNILLYKDSITTKVAPLRGSSSNKYGFYAIPKISKGKYFLVFRNIGFETLVKEVFITISKGSLQLSVELQPADIKLEEVIVSDKHAKEVTVSTINVSPELLKMLPSFTGELDIFRSLQMLPGVKAASEMSNGLYVRGGSPDQTLTLVDGVILYNPAHLGNIASTFNSNAVHDIRLIKGAYPAEYGGRLSSILDIKLRGGTKEKEKGTLGLGSILSFATIEGPFSENMTYMFSTRTMYYDFFQKSFDNKSKIPRYNFFDLNSKLNYNLKKNIIITFSGNYNSDNVYSPPQNEDFNYDIGWSNTSLNFNVLKVTNESLFLNFSASYVNYKFKSALDYIEKDTLSNDYFSFSDLKDIILKSNIEYIWHEDHKFKAGIDVGLHNYTLLNRDYYDPILEISPDYVLNLRSTEAALFLQNEWKIFPVLNTNIGLRTTYFEDSKLIKFEPRISLSFAISENHFIKGAYAVANQYLHLITRNDITLPTDLWYPTSKKIKPSNSQQYVIGIDSYFNNKIYFFSVEAYHRTMKNIYEFNETVVYDDNIPIEENFTKGEGEAYGVELFLNKRTGNFTGWIGYTLSWSRRIFDNLNSRKLFYPRYDRRHDISIVLGYQLNDKISFGLSWVYASGQGYTLPNAQYIFTPLGINEKREKKIQFNYTNRNTYKLPAYHKMDLSINYKFIFSNLNAEAFINIQNLYNRQNAFAQYISTNKDKSTGELIESPKLKQITLMPFIPTIGVSIKF